MDCRGWIGGGRLKGRSKSSFLFIYFFISVSHSVVSDYLWSRGCSLPGSSVHGILQAGILEWVAISFSRGSSQPRNWTQVSCITGRLFTVWATREARFFIKLLLNTYWVPGTVLDFGTVMVNETAPPSRALSFTRMRNRNGAQHDEHCDRAALRGGC